MLFILLFSTAPERLCAAAEPSYVTSRYEAFQPRRNVIGQALDSYEQNRSTASSRGSVQAVQKGAAVPVIPAAATAQAVSKSESAQTAPTVQKVSARSAAADVGSVKPEVRDSKVTTVAHIAEPEYSIPGKEVAIRDPKKTLSEQFLDFNDPKNSMDVGLEVFDYSYREEGFMKVDGTMYGVRSEYAHRFREPYKVNSREELSKTVMHPTVIKLDARLSGMWNGHYRSRSTGEAFGEKHYSYELRAMGGYDYYLKHGLIATPYAGFGYRYLLDDNGGKRTTTGNWGYDRESQYYYIPIGIDLGRELSEKWKLKWNGEYDWFMTGQQKSHFEDDPYGNYTQMLSNPQPRGYGARSSVKLSRASELVDFFVEPFVRYWHIQPSAVSCTSETCGIEPNNRTEEYGLRMGVNF